MATGSRSLALTGLALAVVGTVGLERERLAAMKQHRTLGYGVGLGWCRGVRAVFALMLLLGLAGTAAHAQSASSWNKKGLQAEAREDYDAAFEAYRQARLKKPAD